MGRTYDAIMRAEEKRKQSSRPFAPEGAWGGWESHHADRSLSRWRQWIARREVEPHSEVEPTPREEGLAEQIASLEFTLGALDDQLSRELPAIEQRLLGQVREDLRKLEERISGRIASAADAVTEQLRQRNRRISTLLAVMLAALLLLLFRA